MGNKKSKPKPEIEVNKDQKNEEINSNLAQKEYIDDPVFGRMVYNEYVGAWVPAKKEGSYEQSYKIYLNEKERNKKYLKTFNIEPEKINNYYEGTHQSLSFFKKIKIKRDVYSYLFFLNDGRLAANWNEELKIYSKDFKKIEQKI